MEKGGCVFRRRGRGEGLVQLENLARLQKVMVGSIGAAATAGGVGMLICGVLGHREHFTSRCLTAWLLWQRGQAADKLLLLL